LVKKKNKTRQTEDTGSRRIIRKSGRNGKEIRKKEKRRVTNRVIEETSLNG